MATRVVHCRKEPYDVYIGRGRDPKTGKLSMWGNPFRIGPDGDREEVISKYAAWVPNQPWLMESLDQLRDRVLGCFCKPKEGFCGRLLCHGQVLAGLADGVPPETIE